MTQEKLPHRKELCLQSGAAQWAAFIKIQGTDDYVLTFQGLFFSSFNVGKTL